MLSIIIVSYNTCALLRQCLRSLQHHAPVAQVIVVDNASRDESVDMVRTLFPNVKLIVSEKNLGFAGANNLGFQAALGDFVLLLNSDTYVEDDSLNRCKEAMKADAQIGAASPRLIGFDGVSQACVRPFPSVWTALCQSLGLALKGGNKRNGYATGWLVGAALMIRREAAMTLDGFLDDCYFMYWEDTDICARLLGAGWKLAVFEQGTVRHRGRASSSDAGGGLRPELYACFERGKYRWFARNRRRWQVAAMGLLDAVEVCRRFVRGILRRHRRADCAKARILASVLWQLLSGWAGSAAVRANPGLLGSVKEPGIHRQLPQGV